MSNWKLFLAIGDLPRALWQDPRSGTALGLAGLFVGVVGIWAGASDRSLVGSILVASLLISLIGVAIFAAIVRDKFGGAYVVSKHISNWDIASPDGSVVIHHKTMSVRWLQTTVAIHDYVWGEGNLLDSYSCSPGEKVHEFRSGFRTYVVISMKEPRNRGDTDELRFERRITDGFLDSSEYVEVAVVEPTKRLEIGVTFPRDRTPTRSTGMRRRGGREKTIPLKEARFDRDGRQIVGLVPPRPRQGDEYLIRWDWAPL